MPIRNSREQFEKFANTIKMTQSLLLQAFQGKNKRVPVWFMRQAGRYLPQYRALKRKFSLQEMFQQPELAAYITCLPVDILGVDAAILFADILTLPSQMGFKITFAPQNGPLIQNPIKSARDVDKVHDFTNLKHVEQIIKVVNHQLPTNIPLIGFAGAPFTVLTYLIEGSSQQQFTKTLSFIYTQPLAFHRCMKILTKNTIDYLNLQKRAGIQVFQLFDTWGGILGPEEYKQLILPYVKKVFREVNLPSIYYLKNAVHLLECINETKADFLSVCQVISIGNDLAKKVKLGIQGNLFNGLLYADNTTLAKEVDGLLKRAHVHKKYIFNLSHGVFPDVAVEKLKFVVNRVHRSGWRPS